jgi:hypothetical protein
VCDDWRPENLRDERSIRKFAVSGEGPIFHWSGDAWLASMELSVSVRGHNRPVLQRRLRGRLTNGEMSRLPGRADSKMSGGGGT